MKENKIPFMGICLVKKSTDGGNEGIDENKTEIERKQKRNEARKRWGWGI